MLTNCRTRVRCSSWLTPAFKTKINSIFASHRRPSRTSLFKFDPGDCRTLISSSTLPCHWTQGKLFSSVGFLVHWKPVSEQSRLWDCSMKKKIYISGVCTHHNFLFLSCRVVLTADEGLRFHWRFKGCRIRTTTIKCVRPRFLCWPMLDAEYKIYI